MADYGRVLAVTTYTVGDQLDGDHPIGTTALNLDDSAAFPEEGGTVSTALGLLDFTAVDPDTDTMTLVYPLSTRLPDESRIDLWDPNLNAVATETVASVVMEGSEDDGDPFEADVPHGLRAYLPEGLRDDGGEIVEIDVDAGTVKDVPGRTPQFDGQAVYHPHSFRTTTKTIGSSSGGTVNHVKLNGWADVETDGIDFATATWTIKTPGWYEMRLTGAWTSNPGGRRRLRILLNGALLGDPLRVLADPDDITYMILIEQARLVEGDQVTAWAEQNSGGGLAVTSSFAIYRTSV